MALTGINRYRTSTGVANSLRTSTDCGTRYLSYRFLIIHGVSSPSNGANKGAFLGRINALQVVSEHDCLHGCILARLVVRSTLHSPLARRQAESRFSLYLVAQSGWAWRMYEPTVGAPLYALAVPSKEPYIATSSAPSPVAVRWQVKQAAVSSNLGGNTCRIPLLTSGYCWVFSRSERLRDGHSCPWLSCEIDMMVVKW